MIVAGYYGLMLDIPMSVHPSVVPPSVFSFLELELMSMDFLRHRIVARHLGFLLDIHAPVQRSVLCLSIHILFPANNLSKYQWIFTKRYVH